MLNQIKHGDLMLGIIIRSEYHSESIKFFTPDDFSQQIGYMNRPQGYVIPPHFHNPVPREVQFTKEVLFIKSGKVRVDFYDDDQNYLESWVLNRGDVILLAFGGHGFQMIEKSEIVEVKQGPYAGDADKVRFSSVSPEKIVIKD
jgi:hypothetical protein